jgi:dihydrofolate synthase / folylpolyglutamate synthase
MPAARTLADWLTYQQDLHPRSIDLGLERVCAVAERLELLPPPGRTAIIGGTNGKGSTATLLAALGQAHGTRVGLFTSPHLLRYQERITIDGVEAGDAELVAAFERIESARDGISLTYFEFNTLAALALFRAAAVGLTILEVGLGGRLDATNVVDADVALLCSVGFDHRDWLGETLEAIGAEKAGIFRRGRPAILGTTQMPASVMQALAALECEVAAADRDFHWQLHPDGSWDYHQRGAELTRLPAPALAGEIQYRNAATALAAMRALRAPASLEPAAVAAALRRVRLPGRLQRVAGSVEWVLDVAHNEPAAAVLAHELRAFGSRGRTLAVFGMLADKDVAAVAAKLDRQVAHWLLCTPQGPRALEAARLAERMGTMRGEMEICGEVESACARATRLALPGDRILVCGSFHTVGPALQWRGLY